MIDTINYPKITKAIKHHVCNWCGCKIQKEEKYNNAVYKYDGNIYSWKSHIKCMELVVKLKMEGYYGITKNDFNEYITEEFRQIWIELDIDYYESNKFIIPSFEEQVKFVYENRCKSL
jgi:hypothetical protein